MYLWSKFDDSFQFGYLETELNTTDENLLVCSIPHRLHAMARVASQLTEDFLRMYLWSKFDDFPVWLLRN